MQRILVFSEKIASDSANTDIVRVIKFCMLCYAVPVMPEGVCPYEVSANWACLDGDFAPTTVLAKDGKPLGI